MPWYSMVHTPALQIEIKHFLAKTVSRKKIETQSSLRKGKLKQEDLSFGCHLVKRKNVVMAKTRTRNPPFMVVDNTSLLNCDDIGITGWFCVF